MAGVRGACLPNQAHPATDLWFFSFREMGVETGQVHGFRVKLQGGNAANAECYPAGKTGSFLLCENTLKLA